MKQCPLCNKGTLYLVWGNNLGWTVLFFLLFWPLWLVCVIYGALNKKYRCNLCGARIEKETIDNMK